MSRFTGHVYRFRNFAEMAAHLEDAARMGVPEALHAELDVLGGLIENRAKSFLGHPQSQGHAGFLPWPPLASSTLARKEADTPGIETGEMQASIQHQVVSDEEVQIGTNVPYAKYFEYGTVSQPARPFIEPAGLEVVQERLGDIGAAVVEGMMGGRSMER